MLSVDHDSGEVVVTDERGVATYRGKIAGCGVSKVVIIENQSDFIALLSGSAAPAGFASNLVRVSRVGQVMWSAGVPFAAVDDYYVDVDRVAEGYLWANTWNCYRTKIDPATGVVLESHFTK